MAGLGGVLDFLSPFNEPNSSILYQHISNSYMNSTRIFILSCYIVCKN